MPSREPFDPDPAAAPFEPRHAAIRTEVREWVATHLSPYADEWEAAREFPRSVYRDAGAAGLLGWKYDPRWGGRGPDPLADVVVAEELVRCGSGGVAAGIGATKDLAPYYVARFGTDDQRERWLRPAVAGEAVAGLAVTEPAAGSDVAALTATARRDGDGWRLSGEKVFCTNGSRADWLLVAARTVDEPGPHALALFVVPTSTAGFSCSRIATLGWRTSQTGLLHFDDVALPADAILGAEREGFVMIMKSFQWERLCLAVGSLSAAAANLAAARDLMTSPAGVPGRHRQRLVELAQQLASVRALTYGALTEHLEGAEPLRRVSAAKWLACDLDVETALLRCEVAGAAGGAVAGAAGGAVAGAAGGAAERADRALRDARLGPIGGGAREVMAELVARTLAM